MFYDINERQSSSLGVSHQIREARGLYVQSTKLINIFPDKKNVPRIGMLREKAKNIDFEATNACDNEI